MIAATDSEARLPRRDWVVLPLVCLATAVLLLSCMEWTARDLFTAGSQGMDRCQPYRDPYLGLARPANCSYRSKGAESGWVEETYNNKGYRENSDLTAKPAGVFRIVQVGTSFGVSSVTPKEKTLATLLPVKLSERTGRKIELYNESIAGFPGLPQNIDRRFDDVLEARPDLVLWVLTRWDIKSVMATAPDADGFFFQQQPAAAVAPTPMGVFGRMGQVLRDGKETFADSKSALLLKHFLASSQSQLIKSSEDGPDDINGYLKKEYSAGWGNRLSRFELEFASIARKATAAHVPLVVVAWPSAGQTAMISAGSWDADFDPYKLDEELGAIVRRHGGQYVGVTQDYKDTTNPERGYLPVDSHPNAEGNAMMTNFLTKELTNGIVPALYADYGTGATRGQTR